MLLCPVGVLTLWALNVGVAAEGVVTCAHSLLSLLLLSWPLAPLPCSPFGSEGCECFLLSLVFLNVKL